MAARTPRVEEAAEDEEGGGPAAAAEGEGGSEEERAMLAAALAEEEELWQSFLKHHAGMRDGVRRRLNRLRALLQRRQHKDVRCCCVLIECGCWRICVCIYI